MRGIVRLATVVALGLAVAGCDKCGHWFWESAGPAPQVCKGGTGPSGL